MVTNLPFDILNFIWMLENLIIFMGTLGNPLILKFLVNFHTISKLHDFFKDFLEAPSEQRMIKLKKTYVKVIAPLRTEGVIKKWLTEVFISMNEWHHMSENYCVQFDEQNFQRL